MPCSDMLYWDIWNRNHKIDTGVYWDKCIFCLDWKLFCWYYVFKNVKCASNVKAAFAQIDDMLANRQNEKLSRDFDSCTTVWEEADVFTFVSNLADIFMGTVQYNNENDQAPNITSICKEMTNASNTPYDNLRRLLGVCIYFTVVNSISNSI